MFILIRNTKMKKVIQLGIIFLAFLISTGCKQQVEEFDEYVFAVQLKDDSVKIEEYLNYHKEIWPEVELGFRKAGYKSIRMYRFENYITMIIQVPKNSDLDVIGKSEELNTEKIKEWNSLMTTYQKGLPGTTPETTWVPLDKMYEFQNKE